MEGGSGRMSAWIARGGLIRGVLKVVEARSVCVQGYYDIEENCERRKRLYI
jgi:hypothetical protein